MTSADFGTFTHAFAPQYHCPRKRKSLTWFDFTTNFPGASCTLKLIGRRSTVQWVSGGGVVGLCRVWIRYERRSYRKYSVSTLIQVECRDRWLKERHVIFRYSCMFGSVMGQVRVKHCKLDLYRRRRIYGSSVSNPPSLSRITMSHNVFYRELLVFCNDDFQG